MAHRIGHFYRTRPGLHVEQNRPIYRVLVIQPREETEIAQFRASIPSSPLPELYRSLGAADVQTASEVDLKELPALLQGRDLVHLRATIVDSRSSGSLLLQLGNES